MLSISLKRMRKFKFMVSKIDAGWKIEVPVTDPHAYPAKLIANPGKRSKHEGDAAKKAKFLDNA